MQIDGISTLASVTLAGSLAMERLVVIAKTSIPWLGEPRAAPPGVSEYRADSKRRRAVLAITIAASLITGAFVAGGKPWYEGSVTAGSGQIPWWVFGFMISGGSAFWTSIVGYASATKDVRAQEKAANVAAVVPRAAPSPASVVPTI